MDDEIFLEKEVEEEIKNLGRVIVFIGKTLILTVIGIVSWLAMAIFYLMRGLGHWGYSKLYKYCVKTKDAIFAELAKFKSDDEGEL